MQMKRFHSMNVVPLIDVMLVLLAIVLMTASFVVHDALNLDLPETQSTEAYQSKTDEVAMNFSIDSKNALFLDGLPSSYQDLTTILQDINPNKPIIVKIDKQANFEYFIKLVDALKLKQLNNLTILTKAE